MKYLLGEGWSGPTVTMIQKSVPKDRVSDYVGVYQFFYILSGFFSTIFVGSVINYLNCHKNPVIIGQIIAIFGAISYFGSAVCFQ
jgi:hypothetical protein